MTGSSVAGIITAVASTFLALGAFVTALVALIPLMKRSKRTEEKVDVVHAIVNHQRDVMVQQAKDDKDYNAALIRALKERGVPVPIDQSAPRPEEETA